MQIIAVEIGRYSKKDWVYEEIARKYPGDYKEYRQLQKTMSITVVTNIIQKKVKGSNMVTDVQQQINPH